MTLERQILLSPQVSNGYTALIEGQGGSSNSPDDAVRINAVIQALVAERTKNNLPSAMITIYLRGVFRIFTHIDLPSYCRIVGLPSPALGLSKARLIKQYNAAYIAQVSITNENHSAAGYSGNRNIIIENLEIDHSAITTRGNIIFICHSENIIVRRCRLIQGNVSQGHCVETNACRNVVVAENEFIYPVLNGTNLESYQYDIALPGTESPIPGKSFNADGTNSDNVIVARNWFNGCNTGIGTHTAPTTLPQVIIYENLIERVHVYGIRNYFSRMIIRNNNIKDQPATISFIGNKYGIVHENTSAGYGISTIQGNNVSNLMTVISTEWTRGIALFSSLSAVTGNNVYHTYNTQIYGSESTMAVGQASHAGNTLTSHPTRDINMNHMGGNVASLWSIVSLLAVDPRSTKSSTILTVPSSTPICSVFGLVTSQYTGSINNIVSALGAGRGNCLQFFGNPPSPQGFYRLFVGTTTGTSQAFGSAGVGTGSKLIVSAKNISTIDAFITGNTTFAFTAAAGQNYYLKLRSRS